MLYDDAIPDSARFLTVYGSRAAHDRHHQRAVHSALQRRCLEVVRCLAAWRCVERYDQATRVAMLRRLTAALMQARQAAVSVFLSN